MHSLLTVVGVYKRSTASAPTFCLVLLREKTPLNSEQEPEMQDILPVAVSNPKFCVVGSILYIHVSLESKKSCLLINHISYPSTASSCRGSSVSVRHG